MHWLAFGLAALVTASACNDNAAMPRDEPPPSPHYKRPPSPGPRFIGSRVVLRGRVVSREGNPVPSASLQVMSLHTPHDPPYVVGETTSGVDGIFTFPAVPWDAVNFVVVRGNGGTRTYDRRAAESADPIDLGTLIVGPERDVELVVRCEAAGLDPHAVMQAHVFDETTNELIAELYLTGPLGARGPIVPQLVPGRPQWVRSFDPSQERELRGVVPLPVGEHLLVLYGACGFTTQRLIVPAAGPARFEQTLPVEARDASVLVTLGADACPADVHISALVPDIESAFSLGRRRLTCGQELALGGRIRRVEVSGGEVGPCRAWPTEGHAVRLERGRAADCLVTPLAQ